DDQLRAQALNKEKAQADGVVSSWEKPRRELDDARALLELAEEEGDEETAREVEQNLDAIEAAVRDLELRAMLSGPQDRCDAILEINSGAGGTESMDWAAMLMRMYTRYAQERGWEVALADHNPGQEGGSSSAPLMRRGRYASGLP